MDCVRSHLTNVKYIEDKLDLFAVVGTSRAVAVYYQKGIGRIYFAPRLGVVVPDKYDIEPGPYIQAQTIDGDFLWSDSYEMIDKRRKGAIIARLKRMTKQIKDVLVEYSKTCIEQDFKNDRTGILSNVGQ